MPRVRDASSRKTGGDHVKRYVFNVASAISLLLLVATVVLWMRNWSSIQGGTVPRADEFAWSGDKSVWCLWFSEGRLRLYRCLTPEAIAFPSGLSFRRNTVLAYFIMSEDPNYHHGAAGFQLDTWDSPGHWVIRSGWSMQTGIYAGALKAQLLSIPCWFLLLVSLPLPLRWAFLHRGGGRFRRCICRTCGYNLTGNVSGVCPECGAAIRACM